MPVHTPIEFLEDEPTTSMNTRECQEFLSASEHLVYDSALPSASESYRYQYKQAIAEGICSVDMMDAMNISSIIRDYALHVHSNT